MVLQMTDLKEQYLRYKCEFDAAFQDVMESGIFILGPEVESFEEEVCKYTGSRFAVGVASGTDALRIAVKAAGISAGDEVITTPFTFIATAEAVASAGAKPVFCDIDPKTCNLDSAKIEEKITEKTRAIMIVHLYGQPAELGKLIEICRNNNLKLIEDCAQAFGAEYEGQKVGTFGEMGCFSFFPSKNLGCFGDGGMLVTDDAETAEIARVLRQHGSKISYNYSLPGFNSRLDALQAKLLQIKLPHIEELNTLRRQHTEAYNKQLASIIGIELLQPIKQSVSSANYYTIRVKKGPEQREKLREFLAKNGVKTSIYYPLSLHLQPVYKEYGHIWGDFPECELAQGEVLSLPMYPELKKSDIDMVCTLIENFMVKNS